MKKLICFLSVLILGLTVCWAHGTDDGVPSHENRAYAAIQGGVAFNLYENAFSYAENGLSMNLFTPQAAALIGYDFSDTYGIRLQAAYGTDTGANNTRDTAGGGFYPYSFRHINVFTDITINLAGLAHKVTAFRPKIYAGIGCAYTWDFVQTGNKHPWQWAYMTYPNTVFGFRGGFLGEYTWNSGLGLYADIGGEAYLDNYNGLRPAEEDQQRADGYAGFPLDLRGLLSLGVVYHF